MGNWAAGPSTGYIVPLLLGALAIESYGTRYSGEVIGITSEVLSDRICGSDCHRGNCGSTHVTAQSRTIHRRRPNNVNCGYLQDVLGILYFCT